MNLSTKVWSYALWSLLLWSLVACSGLAEPDPSLENSGVVSGLPTAVSPAATVNAPPESTMDDNTAVDVPQDSPPVVQSEPFPTDGLPVDQPDLFRETSFTLNTTLPSEPTTAPLYQIPGQRLTLETATAVAALFGFDGPLYQEQLPPNFTLTDEDVTFQPQMPFMAFNGAQEQLTIMASNVFYENRAVGDSFPSRITAVQAQSVAEAFLAERGLLTFPYEVRPGFGGDVHFHELINNVLVESPRLVVHVNNEGSVVRVSYTPATELQPQGESGLTTAVSAWAKIEAGVTANQINYHLLPRDSNLDEPLPTDFVAPPRWVRERPAGESAVLYGYPTVLANATNPNTPPRVHLLGYELLGSPEQLAELAAIGGQNTAVQGIISPNGQQLEITGWDLVSLAPVAVQGTLSEANGRVIITSNDGQQYWLPNPPANIMAETAGQTVDIFAWDALSPNENDLPRLEWETMQAIVDNATGMNPALSSFMPLEAFEPYANVTIDTVRLVYFVTPQPEDFSQPPQFDFPPQLLEPMWEFSGVADESEIIRLYVPALGE